MTISNTTTHCVILIIAALAVVWAYIQFAIIATTEIKSVDGMDSSNADLLSKKQALVSDDSAEVGSAESTGKEYIISFCGRVHFFICFLMCLSSYSREADRPSH